MKKIEQTGIVGIRMRIKGKIVDLTIEEAKQMKEDLEKIFAAPKKEYIPYYPYVPYYPTYPVWITTPEPELPYTIWCGDNTSGSVTISSPKVDGVYYGDGFQTTSTSCVLSINN